jgi:predicted porin
MKKSMLALAALTAFAGAASAQSSVTIWGIVDATYAIGNGSLTDKTQVTNSGFNSSRLGFRGVEDMGGGNRAGFWLEAALANDNGAGGATNTNNQASGGALAGMNGGQGLTFGRRSTVSWGGNWGELRLGRDYTPHFWNHTIYDPFGTNGVGTSQLLNSSLGGATTVRASNSIAYLYGMGFNGNSFGPGKGLHAFAQMYRGENNSGAATSNDGNGFSLRVGYDAGPLSLAFANGSTKYAAGKITSTNLGGSYNLGVAKVSALWTSDKVSGGKKGSGTLFGANVPMGTNEIRVAFSRYETETAAGATDGKASKTSLGYVANLSKRTALYATYARVSNSGISAQALNGATTAAGGSSTGMDFGVRHAF